MAQLQEFNLTQLKELIEHNDDHLANNYISQNLAVARNVQATIIKEQFSGSPTLLHEMRILVIRQGWTHVMLNMIEHRFEQGDLIYLGANGIIQYLEASDDVQALGISMSNEVLQLAIGSSIPQAFDGHLRDFHLHLQPDEVDYYDQLHELLSRYFREEGYSSQVTLHLVGALLWYVNNQWSQHEQITRESQTREQRLFTEFVQLVSQYAPQQHTISPMRTKSMASIPSRMHKARTTGSPIRNPIRFLNNGSLNIPPSSITNGAKTHDTSVSSALLSGQ